MPTAISNLQPSLAVTEVILTEGIFPSELGGAGMECISAIRHFAFSVEPGGTMITHGQLLAIPLNTALFSLIGTTYGGDGMTNFALPDLDARLSVGSGSGPGLSPAVRGQPFGTDQEVLDASNMPIGIGGISQPVANLAPTLPTRYLINLEGTFNAGTLDDIGMVWEMASGVTPAGTAECAGQLLAIVDYEPLFALIGTTYGGDGVATFRLPDLRGRAIIGDDASSIPGNTVGTETVTIAPGNLPTEMGYGGQPLDNSGPGLTLRYMICIAGVFPSSSQVVTNDPYLGEIVATAVPGNLPNGWLECNGQLLAINQNQGLFSLLGTNFGGNGQTTFALPDLRGRSLVGAETADDVGTVTGETAPGVSDLVLTLDNIPGLHLVGDGNDNGLIAANDSDWIEGLGGADTLRGYAGDDLIDGGAGADSMTGDTGNDTYVVDDAGDVIVENAGAGTDTVQSSTSYLLGANLEHLTLTGTAAINGVGNEFSNLIIGNDGANIIDGRGGTDSMRGGGGDDTYIVETLGDIVVEAGGGGTDMVRSFISYVLGQDVENLSLFGTAEINGLGNDGNNFMTGNGAANVLNGRGGADTMRGGGGDDTYIVDQAGDTIVEYSGGGVDHVKSGVSYTLAANVENLTFYGADSVDGTGNSLANLMTGNIGNNVLNGGGGADTLRGGDGNDTFIVDNAGDTIVEYTGNGIDVVMSSVSFALSYNLEVLALTGTARISGAGNALDNVITGNAASNLLSGGDGADTFVFNTALGGTNIDTIGDFSVADDTIRLDAGIFTAAGGTGPLDSSAFRVGTAAADADDRIIYDSATGKLYYDADGIGGAAQVQFALLGAGLGLTAADFSVLV